MNNGTLNPLDRFGKLLGDDVFFVPCRWGTKEPLVTYVDRSFEDTQSETYRAIFDLKATNVAVYLGAASGGLCAIDLDDDSDLAAFLALNPALAVTTRSRGSRGGMVWLRIEGDYSFTAGVPVSWIACRRCNTIRTGQRTC